MSEKENYNTIPMIEKACQVVDVISKEGGEAGISEIARQTGMSKSTIFRVLYTLQSWNWIQVLETVVLADLQHASWILAHP